MMTLFTRSCHDQFGTWVWASKILMMGCVKRTSTVAAVAAASSYLRFSALPSTHANKPSVTPQCSAKFLRRQA